MRIIAQTVCLLAITANLPAQAPQKITINYPTRSAASWPLYVAKEAGIYAKYGLDANIIFGVHPAGVAMLVSGEGQWIPVGTDVSGGAAAMQSGRADATLLTAPANYRLEEMGYKNLGNLADFNDIYIATGYLFRKSTIAADPKLPEKIIKAHAE